ncbi:hypothetical protein KY495_00240 [Massilia sp. PAMC28688]|uniref:hypothetical protein n=1 Tax=Massilia sp. PAMC28688 TaxID=2861283 RepID=UPI001C639861|nr:hypothetical protein [Massilia sp. PAMC28688]QYF93708.1 hypothetical protein KY495_00240 [Massilia sp. PAMC28688]
MKTLSSSHFALPCLALLLLSGCSQAKEPVPQAASPETRRQAKDVAAAPQNPGEVAERAGHAAVEQARAGIDDKKRWSYVVMESDATAEEADTLVMPLVKAAQFEMRLQPKDGHIVFTKPGIKHVFKLAGPPGLKGDICPNYNVRVLDASRDHAVFRKVCIPFEYSRDRVFMSNQFFLYDVQTATVRTLWTAMRDQKGDRMPEADPPITVKITASGYRFDWAGVHPGEDGPVKMNIRNVYTRQKVGKPDASLSCADLNFPGKEGLESESCQTGILTLVEKTPK